MGKDVYIIGAGGHTRSIIPVIEHNEYRIIGIFDETFDKKKPEYINTYKIIGKTEDIKPSFNLILSTGECNLREKLFNKYYEQLVKDNLIHPQAIIENPINIGKANQILARVFINSNVEIGRNNLLNSGCIIEHEVKLGSNNHISVGAVVCGRVRIGDNCFIGANAVIIDKVTIGNNIIIGAGSVVIKDIKETGTYAGNPAKRIK